MSGLINICGMRLANINKNLVITGTYLICWDITSADVRKPKNFMVSWEIRWLEASASECSMHKLPAICSGDHACSRIMIRTVSVKRLPGNQIDSLPPKWDSHAIIKSMK